MTYHQTGRVNAKMSIYKKKKTFVKEPFSALILLYVFPSYFPTTYHLLKSKLYCLS